MEPTVISQVYISRHTGSEYRVRSPPVQSFTETYRVDEC